LRDVRRAERAAAEYAVVAAKRHARAVRLVAIAGLAVVRIVHEIAAPTGARRRVDRTVARARRRTPIEAEAVARQRNRVAVALLGAGDLAVAAPPATRGVA